MSLKSSNKIEENVWELEVAVDGETFMNAVNKAYLQQRKKINVPGFRKGKAPRAFIEKMYGEAVFYEDALEIVYPDAVSAAIEEAKLEVIDTPFDLEVPEMGKDGVVIKLKVTVMPEVKLGKYKGIKATKKSAKVSAEDVKSHINNMLEQNSRIVTVETKRKVKKNDIAVIDFEGFVDGVAFEGGKAENYELTIGSNQFIPGFEDQIIGHKAGEEFDVNVKFPEDYHAELAGKDATFKIKLHEIKVKEVPALDDEFVKDVSEYDTVDELKKNVKEELENKKQHEVEAEANNEVLDKLADLVTAVIPDCMIEKKMDDDVQDFAYRLQMQGLDLKTYLKYTGSDEKTFREQYKEQAEKQVKLDLALAEIIKKENLEVSDADLEEEYAQYAKAYNMDVDQIKKAIPADNIKPELLQRKAVDFVIENASFAAEKKPAAKKAAAPKAEKADEEKPAAKKTTKKVSEKKDAE
ncbi:MAG: trigger factor [Ruminococcus sp.]|nr:trigger factor [Ruminococcus sp.]MDY6059291.1 trigger factor [Candidatus Fimenecus sp.]